MNTLVQLWDLPRPLQNTYPKFSNTPVWESPTIIKTRRMTLPEKILNPYWTVLEVWLPWLRSGNYVTQCGRKKKKNLELGSRQTWIQFLSWPLISWPWTSLWISQLRFPYIWNGNNYYSPGQIESEIRIKLKKKVTFNVLHKLQGSIKM